MKKILLAFLSVFLFSFFFLLFNNEKGPRFDMQVKGDSYIEGLTIVHRKNGNKDWILTAKRADIDESGDKAGLSGVTMALQTKGITVYADKGSYNMKDKTVVITGKATAKNKDYAITADTVNLDSISETLHTEGDVKIVGKSFSLTGKGMESNQKEEKVRIFRDVKATFNN